MRLATAPPLACGPHARRSAVRSTPQRAVASDVAAAPRRAVHGALGRAPLRCTPRVSAALAAPPLPRRRRASDAPNGPELLRSAEWKVAGGTMRAAVHAAEGGGTLLRLTASSELLAAGGLVLHWGLRGADGGWSEPPKSSQPPGTAIIDGKAVQSDFPAEGVLELSLPADAPAMMFVLKQRAPEAWHNAPGGGDFRVKLSAATKDGACAGAGAVAKRAVEAETTWQNFSFFNRLCLVLELLPPPSVADGPTTGALFAWLRYSALRLLPTYKQSNYQSKDCAFVQESVAQRFADIAACAPDADARAAARAALGLLPRGGGNGDDIRMGILNIMRAHGIREGHRPGIEDRFIEEWHQKLHTNTGPDDIGICESYLHYLHTGNLDEMYRVLWENHGISRHHLETMDHPIRGPPLHLPHLIPAFQHYLYILRITHGGAQMDSAFGFAHGHLNDHLRWVVSDILQHRNDWWIPGKIAEARGDLAHLWRRPGANRDVVMLDIALDGHFRTLIERMDKSKLSRDDLVELITLTLRNASVTGTWPEFEAAAAMWAVVRDAPDRWSPAWSAAAAAAADFATRALAEVSRRMAAMVSEPATAIGEAAAIDPAFVTNFAEECVRGSSFAALAPLLRAADAPLRKAAGLGAWAVASTPPTGAVAGTVQAVALADVQGKAFDAPTVIVSPKLDGLEDIPAGIVAVITGATVDVLAHVALRARAQGVLLAACVDADAFAQLQALDGRHVSATVTPSGDVAVEEIASGNGNGAAPAAAAAAPAENGNGAASAAVAVGAATESAAWALPESAFAPGVVGGKALSCAALRQKLVAGGVAAPPSVALPYGTFERVLAAPENADVAARVAELSSALASAAQQASGVPSAELAELRSLVHTQLLPPPALVAELAAACAFSGVAVDAAAGWASSEAAFEPVWEAVCAVWASKWADRAWLSRRSARIADAALRMSVLLQPLLPARYAFVLHTTHPLTRDAGTLLGELVCGLGEALVGAHPGRALSFTVAEAADAMPALMALPSKLVAFRTGDEAAGGLIARSDSNGEDLPGFAGAGLYDSVPVAPPPRADVARYEREPLVWDAAHRDATLRAVAKAGWAARDALGGGALDCEGVVLADGSVALVQARPQVL